MIAQMEVVEPTSQQIGRRVGRLERVAERTRDYAFRYTGGSRAISLSLPLREAPFTASTASC